jgi:hypothetical protein
LCFLLKESLDYHFQPLTKLFPSNGTHIYDDYSFSPLSSTFPSPFLQIPSVPSTIFCSLLGIFRLPFGDFDLNHTIKSFFLMSILLIMFLRSFLLCRWAFEIFGRGCVSYFWDCEPYLLYISHRCILSYSFPSFAFLRIDAFIHTNSHFFPEFWYSTTSGRFSD